MPVKSVVNWITTSAMTAVSGLLAVLRLALFVTMTGAMGLAMILHTVRADVHEALLGLGEEMMRFPAAPHEAPRSVQLNGARISLRTQTVGQPLSQVLTHYRGVCERQNTKTFQRLGGALGAGSELPSSALGALATASARTRDSGYVACVEPAGLTEDFSGLADRFLTFSRTEDFRQLGGLRYAYAQRAESDPEHATLLLTIWADSGLSLRQLLPSGMADSAGRDLEGFPRAPGTQRILSAWETERPSGVFIYVTESRSPAELESFYRTALLTDGWTIIERNPGESVRLDDVHMLSAQKGQRMVTVLAYWGSRERTTLTLLSSEPA